MKAYQQHQLNLLAEQPAIFETHEVERRPDLIPAERRSSRLARYDLEYQQRQTARYDLKRAIQ